MKQSFKRLTALILALSMALSLLCGSAWAVEIDPADAADEAAPEVVVEETPEEDIPEESAEESVEPETPEGSVEEVMEPEIPEKPAEESVTAESAEESGETEPLNTASSGTCGENLTWTLDDEGTLTISGSGDMADYSATSEVPWASDTDAIKSVVIEDGVTSIANYAFCYCYYMTDITIPDGVTSIGLAAFFDCDGLKSLTIPESVDDIGDIAFAACDNLETITLPTTVTSFTATFFGDYALKSVVLPQGMTSINDSMFWNCTSLTDVTIPDSVTSIGEEAFYGCTSLMNVVIPASVTSIAEGALGYTYDEEKDDNVVIDGFTISGYTGSAAETYARNNGFTFVSLGTVPFVAYLSDCEISLSSTSYTYNGKPRTPAVTVKYDDKELVQDTDYIVNYENNTDAGTATVTINGRGGYRGAETKEFTINKAAKTITASNITATYSTKKQTAKIGAKAKDSATLTYSSNSSKVKVNSAGKVTIPAKFIGTATITITAKATSNYKEATKKITVTVNPTKTTLSSVTNVKGKKMTVKWKKNTVGTGYQIQYSTSKTFAKSNKTVTIKKKATTSKTISGLTKGKTYYVRIRTYKTVSGKKIYSAWSTKKSVKIKK